MGLLLSIVLVVIPGSLLFAADLMAADTSAAPCTACHAGVAVGPHPHFQSGGDPSTSCVNCHVNAAGHPTGMVDEDDAGKGIMVFRDEPAADRSAVCASCHPSQHPGTGLAEHGRAGVACSDCHQVHGSAEGVLPPAGFEDVDRASATCVGCHEDVFARFAFNERHRLAEGSVSCVSCHDPHQLEGGSPATLGNFAHERCANCHADVAGPFVFEHAASRVDGCGACHEPHGSPNRHLLTHQQEGELCYGCHVMVPQFHTGFGPSGPPRFGLDTVCTNCHTTIHGSNFDRNFLR